MHYKRLVMAKWIRKVRHGLSSFRVGVPMFMVKEHAWSVCKYVHAAVIFDEALSIAKHSGDERTAVRNMPIIRVERVMSGYVLNIPVYFITKLGWESCRYVTIEDVGDNMLIIRRLPGDARKGDESTKHIAQPD